VEFNFNFDFDKTLQATAYILSQSPDHRMKYIKLLKLLYIADRESIAESGMPITGCHPIAMENGPLPEEVYKFVRKNPMVGAEAWAQFISTRNYFTYLDHDPGTGKLSRYEKEKLAEVTRRHERDNEFKMVAIVHELPEWKKNDPGTSSRAIPVQDILEAVGRAADLKEIIEDAQHASAIGRCLKD
jgi:uncharacterized phage-associated protein